MKKLMESITGGYSSSARIVDGALILSLPDALTPVVWRMDMGHAKASAMEVRENADHTFTLTLKTPRGDVNDIAPFATRAQAVKALMAISHAMAHGHGQVRLAANAAPDENTAAIPPTHNRAHKESSGKLLTGVIGVLLLVGIIAMLVSAGPGRVPGGLPGPDGAVSGVDPDAANRPGVPVSADDFLRGR